MLRFSTTDQTTPVKDSVPTSCPGAAAEAQSSFKPLTRNSVKGSESLPQSLDFGSSNDLNQLYGLHGSNNDASLQSAAKQQKQGDNQTGSNTQSYDVQKGDTLGQIAKDNLPKGTSTHDIYQYANEIQKSNGISDPRKLQAGKSIELPEPTDKGSDVSDTKNADKPVGSADSERAEAKSNAQNISDDNKRSDYLNNIDQFQDAAGKRGLSSEEVAQTYHQVNRLTAAAGTNADIGAQVMSKAANPKSVSQGDYNTCGAASLEARTFHQDPSAAAKMVADVALNGKYTASDGSKVKGDATTHADGERDQADEIFQTTAVNLNYQNKTGGSQQYKVTDDEARNEVVRDKTTGKESDFKGLLPEDVGHLSNQITGQNEKGVVLVRGGDDSADGSVKASNSQQEFQQQVKDQAAQGKTPIVWVDSNAQPFLHDMGDHQAGAVGAGHFVRLSGYNDGANPSVDIDNQWGPNGQDGDHDNVSLHDTYEAMNGDPANRAKEEMTDAKEARAAGHPDHSKEIQAIQSRKEDGQIKTDTQYRAAMQNEMKQIQQDWQDHPVDPQEKKDTMDELDRLFEDLKYSWSQEHEKDLEQQWLAAA